MVKVHIGAELYRRLEEYAKMRGDNMTVDQLANYLLNIDSKWLQKHPVLPRRGR